MGKKKVPQDPVLKEILLRMAGEHGCEIADALVGKELTDEQLAKKTGIRLNIVRKILYNLYDSRIVDYRRTRDESSGWYIYYWRIEPERALEFFANNRRLLLRKLEERLERERSTMYFSCSNVCLKVPFDLAAENDFKCPRCGKKLKPFDNTGIITALERQVESLRQHLAGS